MSIYNIRKVDDNQAELVDVLRDLGFAVHCCHVVGKGFPDLAVSRNGITMLIEVKDGKKAKNQRQLTRDQNGFHAKWKAEIFIAESPKDCERLANRFARMQLIER